MRRPIRLRDIVSRLVLAITLSGLIGFLIGYPFEVLFLTCFAMLIWHYTHLLKLSNWLWSTRKLIPPEGEGSWEPIFEGIHRLQKNQRRKRGELGSLVKRFRKGAESLPDGVVIYGKDLSIIWCNRLAQQLLGLKWPDDFGQRLDNLLRNPEFISFIQQNDFSELLITESPMSEELVLEFRIMPYSTDQHMLLARDVTQLKQLEQMRKDFVANVSHELRTPLTVLQGYLEMMDDQDLPPLPIWQKAHLTMIEQTRRMDSLVKQLLKLSKIESSPAQQFEKVVDVPCTLKTIEVAVQALNEEYNHQITFDIDSDLYMYGDVDELQSAFSNLIYNAIFYTPSEGTINVSWRREGNNALFTVSDDGDGIAPEQIARLTERFYRIDKARSRKTGGSGLGLAIVKHILTRHRSALSIASEPGKGSTFSFIIPAELITDKKDRDISL